MTGNRLKPGDLPYMVVVVVTNTVEVGIIKGVEVGAIEDVISGLGILKKFALTEY